MSKHFHKLRVKALKKETLNTVSIQFDLPEELKSEFSYEAGQYLTLKASVNGEELRRSYSISSYKSMDQELQVSCKMIEGGRMSTYLFKELGVNDEIEVMAPMGNFTLDNLNAPLVLFAAGSGITPIFSILKKALTESEQTVHLYYGNRSEEEVIFREELEQLRANYTDRLLVQHFLSSNGERIDTARTQSIVSGGNNSGSALYYICGPEGMIAAVKEGLLNASVAEAQIHIEYFGSPVTEKDTPVVEEVVAGDVNEVKLILDEEEHQVTVQAGESILDAAGRIGIDPPFSCQSGVCTSCRAKVLSGTVEMENNFGLGEDEVEEGYVLTCICKPTSAGVKISWDEV